MMNVKQSNFSIDKSGRPCNLKSTIELEHTCITLDVAYDTLGVCACASTHHDNVQHSVCRLMLGRLCHDHE